MAGTNNYVQVSPTLFVSDTDISGLILQARCIGTPPTTPNAFKQGATITQIDAVPGEKAIFEMVGTSEVPVWNAIGDITPAEITLPDSQVLIGDVTNKATARALSGAVTVDNAGTVTLGAGVVENSNIAADAIDASVIADGSISYFKLESTISGMVGVVGNNSTGGMIPAGSLVKIVGYDSGAFSVDYADINAGEVATHVVTSNFADASNTLVYPCAMFGGWDTSGRSVGDLIYADPAQAGSFTYSAPGGDVQQTVGNVVTVDAGSGVIAFWPGRLQITANPGSDVFAVYNSTGGTLNPGTLVHVDGFNPGVGLQTVAATDCSAGELATHVIKSAILNGSAGFAYADETVSGLNTNAWATGTLLYQSNSSPGTFSSGTPADPTDLVQEIGVVTVQDAVTGAVAFYPGRAITVRIGSTGIQNSAVGSSQLATDSVTVGKIADQNVTYAKLSSDIQQPLAVLVKNTTGGMLPASAQVYLNGIDSGYLTIAPANANTGFPATHVLKYDLANNDVANAFSALLVENIDTSAWAVGTKLYLDPSTPGSYTETAPTGAGYLTQEVGIVQAQDMTTGSVNFYPNAGVILRNGTDQLQDNAVTPPKMNLVVSADLGSPATATDNAILLVTNLTNTTYTPDGQVDTPRNITVTIVDTMASIVSGTVTVNGTGADGTVIADAINISAGAGVYTGTKMFAAIQNIVTSGVAVLDGAGDETIRVGVGNYIGLPSNIQFNVAIKASFLGGAITPSAAYTSGVNTSGVSLYNAVQGDLYDGVKHMIVNYNVGS